MYSISLEGGLATLLVGERNAEHITSCPLHKQLLHNLNGTPLSP